MKFNQLLCGCLSLLLFMPIILNAQSVAINDDGTVAHPSAMLDVKVTAAAKKGVLIPRMTTAERTAIAAPAIGLLVYDTSTKSFWYYNGTAWALVGTGSSPWAQVSTRIYNTNTGNVGIGTTVPKAKLTVAGGKSVLFGDDTLGLGTKAFWLPTKAAFRAGYVEDPFGSGAPFAWDYENIGQNSFAANSSNTASGENSSAFGYLSIATGRASFASGVIAQASGDYAAAFGEYSAAQGDLSFVANGANASGLRAAAFGLGNAQGSESFSANESTAEGTWSSSFGDGTLVRTGAGMAIGQYNDPIIATAESGFNQNALSPIFMVGIGHYSGPRKNAFTILKSGRTGILKNPGSTLASDASLQVKSISGFHALQLEAPTTTNKWSFNVGTSMSLYYNNALRGTFSSTTGGYTAVSDMRLKKDIMPLGSILHQLMSIKTYTYHLKDNEDKDPLSYGMMAQEVMKVMPGLVTELQAEDGSKILGMNYNNFSVLAIRAIQEQQEEISGLKNKNKELGIKVDSLEDRIMKLEILLKDVGTNSHAQTK